MHSEQLGPQDNEIFAAQGQLARSRQNIWARSNPGLLPRDEEYCGSSEELLRKTKTIGYVLSVVPREEGKACSAERNAL